MATCVWPLEAADVPVEHKGVCVEAVVVQRLGAERKDCRKHVGIGSAVADGRSDAKGTFCRICSVPN